MVKIIYEGHRNPCRVSVYGMIIDNWGNGEVKELAERYADKLVSDNSDFKVFSNYKEDKPETEEDGFDVEKATKDELLDYTAREGIEADYSMTKKEIKKLILEEK